MYSRDVRSLIEPLKHTEAETKWPPFPDDIFKWIFLNEIIWISIKISLKFVPRGPISNIPALLQILAWCRPGYTPLSEPMMVSSLTHICVTRPQWVNLLAHIMCSEERRKMVMNVAQTSQLITLDTILRHRHWSTLGQVIPCCLMATKPLSQPYWLPNRRSPKSTSLKF